MSPLQKRMPPDPAPGEVQPDKTGDKCAACGQGGDYRGKRALQQVDGKRMMLCMDISACCQTYRRGMRPAGYATLLREGKAPL